jgi:hypothetical protein
VTFERFEMSGFDVRGDTIVVPANYPNKGPGELGTFFGVRPGTSTLATSHRRRRLARYAG